MAVRKIIFSDHDWAKTGSFSGGSWINQAPLSNLIDIRPQNVAQATDNTEASTQFIIDLTTDLSVGIIYFSNLFTDVACTMQVKVATDSGITSLVYDSGSVNAWASDGDGVLDEDEVIALGRIRVFILPAPVVGRYVQVLFSQTSATTPLRIGCLNICSVFEPEYPAEVGGSFSVIDESSIDRVLYGSSFVIRRGIRNRLNIGLPAVIRGEAFKDLLRLARIRGKSKPLNVCIFPDDFSPSLGLERFSIFGLMNNDNLISNPHFGIYSQAFSIDQLI